MDSEETSQYEGRPTKKSNVLPIWGNDRTMNLNNMVLTNVSQSPYFKNVLYQLKTYHEVVDEIYYKVEHLEPWEKGSRKTSGQVGMCGGVRGVGAGGIVSTTFCILYKLFTLRLTRKQLNGLLTHTDSPYIRALGFMYIRYCQPPADLWDWYAPYLEDEEELDPKAGTGCPMTMGQLVRSFLLKLEWYGTLFPRIPVPIQKDIERKLSELNLCDDHKRTANDGWKEENRERASPSRNGRIDRVSSDRENERGRGSSDRDRDRERSRYSRDRDSRPKRSRSRSRERSRRDRDRRDDRDRDRRDRGREKHRSREHDRQRSKDRRSRSRSRSHDRKRSRSHERKKSRHSDDYDSKSKHRDRSRSKDRHSRSRSRSHDRKRSRSHERKKRRHSDDYDSTSKHRDRSRSR